MAAVGKMYVYSLCVKIVNGKRKGKFELEFYGQDDLQTLLDALMTLKGASKQ